MSADAIPIRKLALTIVLGKGSFGEDGATDTVELSGHRVSASVVKTAAPGFDSADIRIWGVAPSIMNQVSTLGMPPGTGRVNTVALRAGDDQSGMSLVYRGIILEAFQDFNGAPDVALNITSKGAGVAQLKPIKPVSYPQSVSVAQAFQDLAARMEPAVAFENHGVDAMLPPTYLPGTAADQYRRLVEAAGIQATVDDGVLVIWPQGGTRDGLIPDIGPESGLVGYPEFSGSGIVNIRSCGCPGFGSTGTSTSPRPSSRPRAGTASRACPMNWRASCRTAGGSRSWSPTGPAWSRRHERWGLLGIAARHDGADPFQ
jgi:hypothetical protein